MVDEKKDDGLWPQPATLESERDPRNPNRRVLFLMPDEPEAPAPKAECYDCGLAYGEPGFADLVVPHDIWAKISPTGDENGLLCPTCMVRAAEKAGLSNVRAKFRSGPFFED